MKKFIFLLFSLLLGIKGTISAQSSDPNLGIIPAPASVKTAGGNFVISNSDQIDIIYGSPTDEHIAQLFHNYLKEHYSLEFPVRNERDKHTKRVISFSSVDYKKANKESYTLQIAKDHIVVSGKGPGLFYGMQSLMQLFPLNHEKILKIPCAYVVDSPRYKYRGIMLGESYHFFPVTFVKQLIDLMAEYKLNTLHWHLTDDNGWRIQIKKYPLLTKIGAWRKETVIGHTDNEFDGEQYGGYYTQDEIREIVKYAQERYITIIPEIEIPGHSQAALASYPWLGCTGELYPVRTTWGSGPGVYCPKDSTFQFLENVLTEVMELFPSHYIHIGGDEVHKEYWKNSAFCQQLMKEKGLKNEDELQSYFIKRIEKFVNSKGREIIGWDEILEGGLAPNAIVESWRGIEGGIAAAKLNHDVIMAPYKYVYFDYLQGKEDAEPIGIGGYTPLKKVYSYNPTPDSLTTAQKKHVLGVEACVWTEFIATPAKAEYMIFPRLMGLSEIAWTPLERKDYKNFLTVRLPAHLAILDTSGILYRVPETIGIKDDTLSGSKFTFNLKPSVNGATIYYTIDGYRPDRTTFIYKRPLTVSVPKGQKRILKTIVITPSGKSSNVTTTILNNL